jgi:hypothetical protein
MAGGTVVVVMRLLFSRTARLALPGNGFQNAETDKQNGGERQEDGPGVER